MRRENIAKNILIIILAIIFYPYLANNLALIDAGQLNNFLLIISILLVTVCFANFAFTYERVNSKSIGQRWLAHAATFCFMLLMALLLESMAISVQTIYPTLSVLIWFFSGLLYLGIVLYDFWDAQRIINNK
ncbi:MAG: hypothetical protein WC570_04045 [Patescibacteria group bacterium]